MSPRHTLAICRVCARHVQAIEIKAGERGRRWQLLQHGRRDTPCAGTGIIYGPREVIGWR